MCPVGSPAGPEPTRAVIGAVGAPQTANVTSAGACEILGLTASELKRWQRASAAVRLAPSLTFADLLALAVVAKASGRLGDGVNAFALGLTRLFVTLAERKDLERLDDHVALIGRDFARLAHVKSDHIRCVGDGFLVVPLGPILDELRDRVFP